MRTHRTRVLGVTRALTITALLTACGGGTAAPPVDEPDASEAQQPTDAEPQASESDEPADTEEPSEDGSEEQDEPTAFCDLITDEEAAEVLGVAITRIEPGGAPPAEACIKGSERAADITSAAFLSFSVGPNGAGLLEQLAAEEGSEEVAVLDAHGVLKAAEGFAFLDRGGDLVTVQIYKQGTPGTAEEITHVAELLISRLPS